MGRGRSCHVQHSVSQWRLQTHRGLQARQVSLGSPLVACGLVSRLYGVRRGGIGEHCAKLYWARDALQQGLAQLISCAWERLILCSVPNVVEHCKGHVAYVTLFTLHHLHVDTKRVWKLSR
jgi:hypothetical protein